MAFVCVSGDTTTLPFYAVASSGIKAGDVCVFDTTNHGITAATSSSLGKNLACVAVEDAPEAGGVINGIPMRDQLWEWNCANTTAADQLYSRSVLQNAGTVNNTSTDQSVAYITVIPLINVGTNKQRGLLGRNVAALS